MLETLSRKGTTAQQQGWESAATYAVAFPASVWQGVLIEIIGGERLIVPSQNTHWINLHRKKEEAGVYILQEVNSPQKKMLGKKGKVYTENHLCPIPNCCEKCKAITNLLRKENSRICDGEGAASSEISTFGPWFHLPLGNS